MSTGRFEQPWEALERIATERQRAAPVSMDMLTAITPRDAGIYMRRIQAAASRLDPRPEIRGTPFVQMLLVAEYVRVGHGSDTDEAATAAIGAWETLNTIYQGEQRAAALDRADAARRAMTAAATPEPEGEQFGYRDDIPPEVPSSSIRPSRRRTFAELLTDTAEELFSDQPIFDEIQRQWRELTGELSPTPDQMRNLIAALRTDYNAIRHGHASEAQFRAAVGEAIARNRDRPPAREEFPAPIPTRSRSRYDAFTGMEEREGPQLFASAAELLQRYEELRTTTALAWIEFEARGPVRRFTLLCLLRRHAPGLGFRGGHKRIEDGLYETTPAEALYIFNQINTSTNAQAAAGDSRAIDLE